MRRTDLLDTSKWAHNEMVRRLRKLTVAQRAAAVVEYSEFMRQMKISCRERELKRKQQITSHIVGEGGEQSELR